MNKALLFNRPGESEYNRFRRLVVANCGTQNLEEKLALPKNMWVFNQCPECSKNIFHSEVNEFFWLKKCPIHLKELTSRCPCCRSRWPRLTELPKVKCAVCGGKMGADDLADIPSHLNLDLGVFEKIRKVFDSKNHPALNSYKFTVVDRFNESMPRRQLIDTDWYPSFVAAHLELSDEKISSFQKIGVEFPKLKKLKFKWDECSVVDQNVHSTFEYELQGGLRAKVFDRIVRNLNQVAPKEHRKFDLDTTDYCNDKTCPLCITHRIVKESIKHENVDFFSRNQKLSLQRIYPSTILPNMAFSLLHFNHYRLPRRVSRLIYYLDFWLFCIKIFYYFSSQTKSEALKIKYDGTNRGLDVDYQQYLCPIQIVENRDDGLTLYYPAIVPIQELPIDKE